MNAGTLGQCAVVAIALYVALRFAHRHGFLRGWKARDAKGGAVRMAPPLRAVRGSYRARKTPITFPIPVHDEHDDAV